MSAGRYWVLTHSTHDTLRVHWRDVRQVLQHILLWRYSFKSKHGQLQQTSTHFLTNLLPPGGKTDRTSVSQTSISCKCTEQMLENKASCKTNDFVVFSLSWKTGRSRKSLIFSSNAESNYTDQFVCAKISNNLCSAYYWRHYTKYFI